MSKMRDKLGHLLRDRHGKAPVKLVLATTSIALSVAMTSPTFKANPMLHGMIGAVGGDMEKILPETLDRVTAALKGS